jgi:lysophospholipase L1-like esterase
MKVGAVAVTVLVMLGAHRVDAAAGCRGRHWVGAWATSPSDSTGGAFVDQSLRLVVNPTLGGVRVRVRLSNRYGSRPVTFGAVTIARRGTGAALVPGTSRPLRFTRQRSVTVPPGGEVVSDPRRFEHDAFEDVVVSLHVVGTSGPATEHALALQTSYSSGMGTGDHTRDEAGSAFTNTLAAWAFLTDVEVRASRRIGAVVALGDSITDGFPGPSDQNGRYPDLLARRLAAAGARLAVQNAGISGNRVLRDGLVPSLGPRLLDRLDHDAIDQVGASVVILMEGTNDLGLPPTATPAEVIAGLQSAIERMRRAGLRVLVGTQTPCTNFALALHGTPAAIAARNEINDWIRTNSAADGVIDFHAALRDPTSPDRLRAEFDSGDHLHPSAAGYAAMAEAIDLNLLNEPARRSPRTRLSVSSQAGR